MKNLIVYFTLLLLSVTCWQCSPKVKPIYEASTTQRVKKEKKNRPPKIAKPTPEAIGFDGQKLFAVND